MTEMLECFKAYDVRGRIPDQLNESHRASYWAGLCRGHSPGYRRGGPRYPLNERGDQSGAD